MELHIAIQVADERDHRHLSTTLRLANQRGCAVQLVESPLEAADVVILRRGEPESATLFRSCESAGKPRVVVYTSSDHDNHSLILRWPARTTDLIPLAESLAWGCVDASSSTAGNPPGHCE